MSRFFSARFSELVPYIPGEQPQNRQYIKLNTNESPFPPSPRVAQAVEKESERLALYSDPECVRLRSKMAEVYHLDPSQIVMTNGSDEVLNFAFMAFADENAPLAFADITYGFYPVFAQINRIPYTEIPLKNDFVLDPNDYIGINKTVVIANPNAPTGKFLPLDDIERIVKSNPDNVVIVDEAYVDFGGESAVTLINRYDNLLVTGTFSKSRSMAGARIGFGFGNPKLIADLNTLRYSTNPYNVNLLSEAAGVAALEENDYYMDNCKVIMQNRTWTTEQLRKLGFHVLDSKTNFVFAESDRIEGGELYRMLKEKGILIRHFDKEKLTNFNRITIGTMEQMQALIKTITELSEERKA
ncbi:MAG TPA: histidinol-phosphate transaminase [Ruminococcaceae bacterium]|nr:histidinol-phosphate transaminase [Oscillospiraceae bacterium]